jgi:FkbM family methyltransferase
MASRLVLIISVLATVLLLTLLVTRTSEMAPGFSTTSASQPNTNLLSVDTNLNAKLAHAEKLWQQSVEDRKKMVTASGYNKNFPDGYIYPFNVWDFARPSFFFPHDLERVGTLGDGGKIVCGMTRYESECPGPSSDSNSARELIVYSFGVSDDSSFEAELLQRTNARIWGYDSSVDSWAEEISGYQYSRAQFTKARIGKVSDGEREPPVTTIQDLMRVNGHSYVDLIKMDIEGAEFDALTSLIESIVEEQGVNGNATLPFGQLLIEIHFMKEPPGLTIPNNLRSWMRWWSSLEAMGLRPVNNEDNWIGDVRFGKPRFMEVRFSFQPVMLFLFHLTDKSFTVYPHQCDG